MNKHGKNFLNLLKEKSNLINFNQEREITFNLEEKRFTIPIIELKRENIDEELIKNIYNISLEKAEKTMKLNQNLEEREQYIKIIKSFRGILAETIVHLYLHYICEIPIDKIKRYDLERETFEYKKEEYDIKICSSHQNTPCYIIEVRSSNNPYENIEDYLAERGIICAYTNNQKKTEEAKDISIAIIYKLSGHKGNLKEKMEKNFFEDFYENKYTIYFPTHCALKETCYNLSKKTNLGQNNTEYYIVPFSAISDSKYHIKNIIKKLII